MSRSSARRIPGGLARVVGEIAPAYVLALAVLPWIISGGSMIPWRPATIDLDVYRYAVADLLAGKDIYLTRTPVWDLPFIYPPFAALLMIPFGVLPNLALQLVWTAITVWSQWVILVRLGLARGVRLACANALLVVAVEPFRTTLGYGQVNTVLMALVVADLLPSRARSRLPRGSLIGFAAAIKLIPLIFVVFAWLIGRRKTAQAALISFGLFTVVGVILLPRESFTFAGKIARGDTYGDPVYVGNQSLSAVFARLSDANPVAMRVGTLLGAAIAVLALAGAWHLWRRGERVFAVGVTGLASCLASPLSWTHHHVWLLPVAIGALTSTSAPRPIRAGLLGWAAWNAVCPMLAFLPYGDGKERAYAWWQQAVADTGPLLATVMVAWLFAWTVSEFNPRRRIALGRD